MLTDGPPRRGASLHEALSAQNMNGTPDKVAEFTTLKRYKNMEAAR
jgi:hypothetical protein